MRPIRLIVVPYEVGRLRDGVGKGPEHLLSRGAEMALRSGGADVRIEVIELAGPESDEIDASFELIRMTARQTAEAVAAGEFPVVLSGSCAYPAVGVVAGLGEVAPGVAWFDAHGDFNSPDTADSGYFDGMGMAVLTGSAWQGMLATVDGGEPIPETAVLHVGGRDFDDPEQIRLEASAINRLTVDELRAGRLAGCCLSPAAGVKRRSTCTWISTSSTATRSRSTSTARPNGLSPAELESAMATILDAAPVRALSLTAYDPNVDRADAVPPIALRLLEASRAAPRGSPS